MLSICMIQRIKDMIRRLLGEKAVGYIDYFRFPKLKKSFGPFNGQRFRQQIFNELISKIDFFAIVETGTYRGETTYYMQKISKLTVYTAELVPRIYGSAKIRFLFNNKIKVFCDDSRKFLKKLAQHQMLRSRKVFFYLDAHRYMDLPLLEEISIIFTYWSQAVIMIDDFKVPDDSGYGYDRYGAQVFDLNLLNQLDKLKLVCFFPSLKSEFETGYKRGCVILAIDDKIVDTLKGCNKLVFMNDSSHARHDVA